MAQQALQIEHGIPIPPPRSGRTVRWRYPLARMAVGDSFFVPGGCSGSVIGAVIRFVRAYPGTRRFVTRQYPDGVRVWRVE
jgi:hypothetical protein